MTEGPGRSPAGARGDPRARRVRRDYDRRWARYIERTTRQTMARLALAPGERLLDVGCGTGVLLGALHEGELHARSRPAQGRPPVLTGIDLSPEMLSQARVRLPAAVALVGGDATRLPLRDASFDVVVSDSSFHYWPDPAAGLRELRRVLRPGGRLVVSDWCDDFLLCRICDSVLRLVDGSPHRIFGAAEFRRLLEGAGFGNVRIGTYRVTWLWGMMTAEADGPRSTLASPARPG